ncbi:ATP-binding cassette domain-containing protein [Halovulum dunhuangense]|uniref:ATP-binding cassette domain-containing protein n=1 Tax=Halovulum dunhuangense TaxID=1505036 RepID=A0A849KVY2_9RHOB|nr:ATP-binding cassette domain-containing protein [Halovulum dunhuangense]NNU79295.1 ATP-binding cassette domain-containing protein [Halovulum dunhuangense]
MDLRLEGLRLTWSGFSLEADLAVPEGDSVAVIGPSGAGKSTLLALIAGFEAPDTGRILFGGDDLTATGPAARPVTMVFQDNNLFPHLSLSRNVGLGLDPSLRLDRAGWARVEAALAEVGLAGLGDRKPGQLSGGQQSRAALARALLRNRPILLLDEPFAALGPALRREMLDLVARIRAERGMTLLMVTHDPEDAARIAAHTIFLAHGRAAPPAPTRALLADPPPALAAYLGSD